MKASRRRVLGWVGGLAAMAAAWALKPGTASAHLPQPGQFPEQRNDGFHKAKVLLHLTQVQNNPIGNVATELTMLEHSYQIEPEYVAYHVAVHGAANLYGYNDAMWEKYELGKKFNVTDPATGQPAIRNIFYPQKNFDTSVYPYDPKSFYMDGSVEALVKRGVQITI